MSTARTYKLPLSPGKGPNGRNLCRVCAKEVPPRNSSFCSHDCVHEYRLRSDPGYVRFLVEKRDQGVCAVCGRDTEKFRARLLGKIRKIYRRHATYDPRPDTAPIHIVLRCTRISKFVLRLGGRRVGKTLFHRLYHVSQLWDADHALPVCEGGGLCGLDGFRTLCLWCHAAETAALLKRRAAQRRESKC